MCQRRGSELLKANAAILSSSTSFSLLWLFKSIHWKMLTDVFFLSPPINFLAVFHSVCFSCVCNRTSVDVGDVMRVRVCPHPCYQCVTDIPRRF